VAGRALCDEGLAIDPSHMRAVIVGRALSR